ncbi:MAG: ubiquinone biosynthesis regulatory protein kinase UbiB [Proteobacteria bacterium]|nr:MAG: ubiquinone biosynthesis regulatory protein kinase UbiB [Pseudomonadota bacterium]
MMKSITRLLRLWTIGRVFIRHGLDELVFSIPFMRPMAFLYYLAPWNWRKKVQERSRGERIRLTLEELGPIFIKFGQMLSTRRDLMPPDIAQELARLQDRVPPFASNEARELVEKALGKPVTEVFKYFEAEAMASASIAQVHAAQLWDGKNVVVKVLRPHIDKTIRQDLELMYIIAHLIQRHWREGRRLRPVEVVSEYEKNILDELDLVREAANASQLRHNFENNPMLYIPEVYWRYTHKNVMVMERIYGIPMGNIDELKAAKINFKRLAELGVETFFTQVFIHNFFHADMHPGNIFVNPAPPNEPQYMAVDFGIVGTLSPEDKRYLAENFHAFFNRDYKRVAKLHVASGWVSATTRVDEFEAAIRTVSEPIFNLPLKDISFGFFLMRLFQVARRFDMEVQPQLVLLQKTLLNIEGLGRQLYPDLDLWATAKPFLENWMDKQVGFRALLNGFKDNLPRMIETMPYMPNLLYDIAKQTEAGKLKMQWESQQIENLRREIAHAQSNTRLSLFGALLLIIAFLGADSELLPLIMGIAPISLITGSIGTIVLIYSLLNQRSITQTSHARHK